MPTDEESAVLAAADELVTAIDLGGDEAKKMGEADLSAAVHAWRLEREVRQGTKPG